MSADGKSIIVWADDAHLEELRAEALKALGELPSLYQAIGGVAAAARRCKPDSKRGKELWDRYTKLGNEAADASSKVRMFLTNGMPLTKRSQLS